MSPDIAELSPEDRERLKRGAQVSVTVGPCPDCGYTWKANPRAGSAECPRCVEAGVGAENDDIPTVDVPSWGGGE